MSNDLEKYPDVFSPPPKGMKDNYRAYEQKQRSKQTSQEITNYGYNHKGKYTDWFDSDRKVWESMGRPLYHKASEYDVDEDLTCSYCDKPLCMAAGGADTSTTDMCCFECFEKRKK